jgi:hypothetical protein
MKCKFFYCLTSRYREICGFFCINVLIPIDFFAVFWYNNMQIAGRPGIA